MQGFARTVRRYLPAVLLLTTIVSFSVLVGCNNNYKSSGGGGGGGGATTSSFAGWLANGSESGLLTVTISKAGLTRPRPGSLSPAASVTATGSLVLTGTTTGIAMPGTFDDETGELHLTGGGYTVDGLYDVGPPSNLSGIYRGPNGAGQFSCESGAASSAQVYGGSYLSDASGDGGTFLMAVRGTAIHGVATADGDSMGLPFAGTLAGTAITIQAPSFNGYTMHGTGTLNTTTHHVSGRYNIDLDGPTPTPADSGAWVGDLVHTP